jgi:uncharacterized membrane protein
VPVPDRLFSLVCGREHVWTLAGEPLPFCQRCTGLYVGGALAVLLLLLLRPRPTPNVLWVHGLLLLLMVPFGFNWIEQGPTVRMLTGQLFALGLVYFLGLAVEEGDAPDRAERGGATLAQGGNQLDQRLFSLAVHHDVDQSRAERLGRDVAKEAAAGDHARSHLPGEGRESQALDAADGLFAQADPGGPQPAEFPLQAPPAHLERGRVEDPHVEVAQRGAHGRGQRGERQWRPEGAAGAVEGPQRPRWPDEQQEFAHGDGERALRRRALQSQCGSAIRFASTRTA